MLKRLTPFAVLGLMVLGLPSAARSQSVNDGMRRLDESLTFQTENGFVHVDLNGHLDLETYYIDQRPPGLIFPDDKFFFNPGLTIFSDVFLGDHVYLFGQLNIDRGLDAGYHRTGQIRMDEYFARYSPMDEGQFNLQAGQFATFFGNWVPRHDSLENPFINAPLAYENVVTITDAASPAGPDDFLARKNRPLGDNKLTWIVPVWGPSYTAGVAAFGRVDRFDYAIEMKNGALSSRPPAWGIKETQFQEPAWTGRLGYRPNAAWNVGASASYGAYMLENAVTPAGSDRGDYKQLTVGADAAFAWHHWQIWGEAIASRFDVPNVGDVETLAYYLEGKYKFNYRWYSALRWNQQFFDSIRNGAGRSVAWDNDIWRIDWAVGSRINQYVTAKLQYSYSHQKGGVQQGEQLAAAQLIWAF